MKHASGDGDVLILYGDVPLIAPENLKRLVEAGKSGLAVMTTEVDDPKGYGRVVRTGNGAEVTRFHSGPDGRFKVDLAPGSYTLIGLTVGSSFLPRPIPTSVKVTPGTYTVVNVEYDSGIR